MTRDAKIIGSSIILGVGTIGISIASLAPSAASIAFPLIITLVGLCLFVNSWTEKTLVEHAKAVLSWAKDYDNLDNRLVDPPEEGSKVEE